MNDLIKRADAMRIVHSAIKAEIPFAIVADLIKGLPSANAVSSEFYEDAVKANIKLVIENRKLKEQIESADAEPIVIRSKTLMPTKDFKEWAKRIREVNPNAVVIPCDAEVESADAVPIVYCMDCAKSEPLDEHGALWKCKAHDRTTLRHSYCNNGERKGGDTE